MIGKEEMTRQNKKVKFILVLVKERGIFMKKKIWFLLVMVTTVLAITACGSTKDKTTSEQKSDEEEGQEEEIPSYKFTIWGRAEDLSEENGSWLKTRCDMFAAKYPDNEITFEFKEYSPEDAMAVMEKDRENAPDIYIFTNSQVNELVEDRLLTRLWGETEEYVLNSNAQEISDATTYQGKVYGIPVSANPYVLYYDKTVYTQEDVKSLETILQKGRLSYPLENATYTAAFGEVDASFLNTLKKNSNLSEDEDVTQNIANLQAGAINAMVSDSSVYQQVKEAMGEERMGVAALPTYLYNGETRQMKRILNTQIIGVNPDCDNFEMTIALATYLGSADSQQMHYDMSGAIPVNISAMQTLKENALTQIVSQVTTEEDLQRLEAATQEKNKEK